jgi:DNA repair exonuclease SbcCD ATPase subunit
MTGIYLSRIGIHDFRTFGAFEVSIPAAAGLTILTGTNGLGKSNFFDAIEWGLTGNARRFQRFAEKNKVREAEYLTRAGASPDSHRVTLGFNSQIKVKRGIGFTTPQSEIIGYLANQNKKGIQDLETYLALTHFLGQASDQRFTSREEKDQWKALRGPSGIDQLESVRERIKHRSITMAFTRRNQDEQETILDIEQKLAQWEGWQVRLARLKQAMSLTGTLTSEEVHERIQFMESELADSIYSTSPAIEGADTAQRLAQLGSQTRAALSKINERIVELENFSTLVDMFATAALNADLQHPVLVRARDEVENARALTNALSIKVKAAVTSLEAQSSVMRGVENEINVLESARLDLTKRADVAAQIILLEADQKLFSEAAVVRQAALFEAKADVQRHSDAASVVATLKSDAERARLLALSHEELIELDRTVTRDTVTLASAEAAAAFAKVACDSAVEQRSGLYEGINNAAIAYSDSERQATAISAAVATIASHISHDDKDCPVCSTSFEAGHLKLLAEKAAQAESDTLARLAVEIAEMRTQLSLLDSRIQELTNVVNRPRQLAESLKKNRAIASRARAGLAAELGLEITADLNSAVSARREGVLDELTRALAKQEVLAGPAAAAGERRRALIEDIDSQVAQQTQLNVNLSQLRSEENACSERMRARGMASWTIKAVQTRLVEQRSILEVARARMHKIDEDISSSRSELDSGNQTLSAAERALADSEMTRLNAQEQLTQLELRWSRGSLDGVPSRVVLDKALSAARANASSLRNKQVALDELATNNQELLAKVELDEVIASMKSVAGEEANSEQYVKKLKEDLAAATASAQRTSEAQRAVNSFARTLKSNVEEYSAQVLTPLNDVISDFNEAMLSSPGQSIQFSTTHRVDTTTFGMSLQQRARLQINQAASGSIAPQLTLSEGQLAANGFSILCAASTRYQWSRWRALLLDDPLQHNDIIHTSAFIDVMRNLVEFSGYQLIMSTHDKAESDFIARKFDAAGLPCTRISLTGPSSKGVLFDGPIYNSAAEAIIYETERAAVS